MPKSLREAFLLVFQKAGKKMINNYAIRNKILLENQIEMVIVVLFGSKLRVRIVNLLAGCPFFNILKNKAAIVITLFTYRFILVLGICNL